LPDLNRSIHGMKPRFLNVDLEIESRTELNSLAADMGEKVVVLYSGPIPRKNRHLLAIEASRFPRGPDATIRALCAVIEGLNPKARTIWKAGRKTFDVGFELRPSERVSRFTFRSDTLTRIANLGATLTVTYYRREKSRGSSLFASHLI
jgi:hypothetical protein